MRLMRLGGSRFGSGPQRRQNFFELNPIFPDQGQKDFDIYNVDYKHGFTAHKTIADETRYKNLKAKLTQEVYLAPVLEKNYGQTKGEQETDSEYGFPIGIHENFDNFIEIFKREKKVGSNVVGEFEELVMRLMHKFEAKSELELIKIFRLNLANSHKHSMKDKIRSLVINSAFISFMQERKTEGIDNQTLTIEDIEHYSQAEHTTTKKKSSDISKDELSEIITRQTLLELDAKIMKIEDDIQAKAIADGTYIPTYHPKYGLAIQEEGQTNL